MRWSFYILPLLAACSGGQDTSDLQVVFDDIPPALTNQRRTTLAFHVEGPDAQLTCALDSAAPAACSSPFTADVADGRHTVTITATGAARQSANAIHTWAVDTAAPDTEIMTPPTSLDPQKAVTVQFAGGPDVDHFECALDGAPFARCSSPVSLALADGSHTFEVRAVDAAGNVDPTPAAMTWMIDHSAPAVTFTDGPEGPIAMTRATFAFTTPPKARDVACALDGGELAPCSSPVTTPELAQGPHVFAVSANDVHGRAATASRVFVVDTIGPGVTITRGPEGASSEAMPTWGFTVTGEPATVQCRIDGGAWTDCASGAFTAGPLADGPHRFDLEAADALGNLGTASRSIAIDSSTCGDGVIDRGHGETCDGTNLAGTTCAQAGDFDGGTLACTTGCALDTSGCHKCGNGAVEDTEACDGANLAGASCGALGFTAGTLACDTRCQLDTSGCGVCGDGTAQQPEACDGGDLGGATCASLGHAPGTLACAADCGGYDTRGCTGGYVPANLGFSGRPCFDGLRYSTPQLGAPYVLACTEDQGLYKTTLGAPLTWTSVTAGGITNPRGRAVAVNPSGPPVYFVADASTPYNAFRSSTSGDTWVGQSIASAGVPRDLFTIVFRSQIGNIAGSWDPQLGATVLHGSAPNLTPHFVGPSAGSVTGTVRAIASGGPKDVYVAVYGQTPSGAPATGGIFRACDLTATGGGSYVERDTGIAPDDLARVWSITVDPASVVATPFQCGLSTSSGSATTYYAALRGGGQIYKTGDGGLTWSQSNAGLPPGAEVYAIAVHCYAGTTAPTCQDHNLLYAATSAGLYRSADAGAHWTLDGFEGQVVRAVALDPSASPPHRFVAVDDAVGIYQSL